MSTYTQSGVVIDLENSWVTDVRGEGDAGRTPRRPSLLFGAVRPSALLSHADR